MANETRLDEAVATLLQTQTLFLGRLAETDRLAAEYRREADARFLRIEAQLAEIVRVLNEHTRLLNDHTRILERLPEAVREKIGFRGRPGEAE